MNTSFKATLLALNALEKPMTARQPALGLSDTENRYTISGEQFGWRIEFAYEINDGGVDLTSAEIIDKDGRRLEVPLEFFPFKDYAEVVEEITEALADKAFADHDPGGRGDYEYDAWREKQYANAAAEDFGMTRKDK